MNYDYSKKIVELLENAEKKNKEVIDLLSKKFADCIEQDLSLIHI